MKKSSVTFAVFSLCAVAGFGQVPKNAGQVSTYPGSKLISAEQSPTEKELASGKAPNFAFAAEKVWSSSDSVDQVARFYAGKLGAAIGQEGGGDPNELEPGQSTTVGSAVDYYEEGCFDESSPAVRAGFAKRQKLSEDGGWVRSAGFSWAYKSADEDPYSFILSIVDKSLSEEDPSLYRQATEIRLSVRMMNQKKLLASMSGAVSAKDLEAMKAARKDQEAYGEEMKKKSDEADAQAAGQKAEADRAFGKAPTEAELGVPVYPGAAYDKDESALRSVGSTGKMRCYAYFVKSSGDVRRTIEDVTRFYEQKTKRNRLELSTKDMSEIPFAYHAPKQKGDKPAVKDEIVVGYNGVKGMISIWIVKDQEQKAPGGR
jgi:hypothetical protein